MIWLKRLAKISLAILGGILFLLLVFTGINLFDEDLNPAVKPLLDVPAISLAPERNGHLYLLGFNATADKNPHAVGVEIEKIIHAHYRDHSAWMTAPKIDKSVTGHVTPIPYEMLNKICDAKKHPCLDRYLSESVEINKLVYAHKFFLERYRRLIAYPDYQDRPMISFNDNLPNFANIMAASRLTTIVAAHRIAAGEHRGGLETIANDIRFWRRMLSGSTMLIGKMLAARRIEDNFKLLNELMARYPAFARDQAARLADDTRPLSQGEGDFCSVLRHEQGIGVRTLHAINLSPWKHRAEIREFASMSGSAQAELLALLAPAGYVPNATLNLLSELHGLHTPMCAAKPALLVQTARDMEIRRKALIQKRARGASLVYNPIGKSLLDASYGTFVDYRYRLLDLDGLMRATHLHARIRAAGVGDNAIPALITRAGAGYHDPYTDKPIAWNPKSRTLIITWNGKPGPEGGVVNIKLGR